MSKKAELAVIISDTHCGSEVGLAPPETKTRSGNVIGFGDNLHQKWLWAMWQEGLAAVKKLVGNSNAVLIVNGDATEGVHHRNEPEIMAALIETHCEMAAICFEPYRKLCSKIYVTKGTECHTKDIETLLAKKLKAECGEARDKWLISINGILVDIAHHMPTTGRAYLEASAMSIMMGNAQMNYMRAGQQVPRIFCRAHRHCGGSYNNGHSLYVVTGAFQMLTRHGHKVVTDSLPRPMIQVLDWRGKAHGELPVIHSIAFDPPQHEIETI